MTEEFVHVLDKEGRCGCGGFAADLADPNFTDLAIQHFDEVTEAAVRRGQGMTVLWMVAAVAVVALVVTVALVVSI